MLTGRHVRRENNNQQSDARCTGIDWGKRKTCEEMEVFCELVVAADWLQGEVYNRAD